MLIKINSTKLIIVTFLIKIFGIFFSLFIFNKFSPLIDSNLYLNHYFIGVEDIRTRFIQGIVVLLSFFDDIIIHFIFSCFSVIGFLYATIRCDLKLIYLLFLLLPSSLIWTSIVGKEAIFYGFFTLLLFIWIEFLKDKLNFLDIILITLSFIVCAILRPHYLVCIVWLYLSLVIVKYYYNYKNLILILSFTGLFFSCFIIIYSDTVLWRALSSIEYYARASRFVDFNILPPQIGSDLHLRDDIFIYFKEALIKNWIYSIIGPRFNEIFIRIEFIPFFIEGIFILSFPIICYLYALKMKINEFKKYKLLFFYCLIPSLMLIILVHAPFGILNPGTGIRWRVNFETIFYITPLLIFFNYNHLKIK